MIFFQSHPVKQTAHIFLLFFLCFIFQFTLYAEEVAPQQKRSAIELEGSDDAPVEVVADDVEHLKDEGKTIGRGNVVVTRDDVKLLADYVEVYTDTKKAFAEGHVTILRKGKGQMSGEKGFYDFKNHQGSFPNGQIVSPPWYITGEQIEQVAKDQINLYQAVITTCAYQHTHWDIQAKQVVVYPGDKMIAWNLKFRVLNMPVFWWPYMIIPLDQSTGPFELRLGQSKSHGNYALIGKTFSIIPQSEDKEVKTKVHVDLRKKRGTALGNETWYHIKQIGDGNVKLYWIKDDRAPDPAYFSPADGFHTKQRYRVTWKHRTDFGPLTNLIMQWNKFSDREVLHDFFEREFDEEPIPQSFATFTHNAEKYGLLIDFQRQANSFDNVLERLPEIRFNWRDQELKESGIYYNSQTQYVNYHHVTHADRADPVEGGGRRLITEFENDVSRTDTFHELSYPKRYLKYYDLTPRANIRITNFRRNLANNKNKFRRVYGLGGEASTRFYRFFDVPRGSFLGIKADRIRHIVKPIVSYSGNRLVSTRPALLKQFDSIDGIAVADSIRFGIENRIQTKSNGRRVDIVSLNTYVDYIFNNSDRETRFQTGTAELILRPYPWFQLQTRTLFDMKAHRRTEQVTDAVVKTKYIDFSTNHRYVMTTSEELAADSRFSKETNVIAFKGETRLNNRWKIAGYFRFDARRHDWREYEWEIIRDLHDWTIHFGQNIRHSEVNFLNHELFFEIQLNALPGAGFTSGQRANFADARIGETVSGANQSPAPNSLLPSSSGRSSVSTGY